MSDKLATINRRVAYVAYSLFVVSAVAVNFLTKWGTKGHHVDPTALSGMRLTLGGVILLIVALRLGIGFRVGRDIWRYALVALTAVALPQAILFASLARDGVTPNDAA